MIVASTKRQFSVATATLVYQELSYDIVEFNAFKRLYSKKMRSRVNHCYGLRFLKPRTQQIRDAISVYFKKDIKLPPDALDEIIMGTGNDVRQMLNHLAMYSKSKMVENSN